VDNQVQIWYETADGKEGKFDTNPKANRNNCMMEYVQETNMTKFLPQYKEYSIKEIEKS